MQDKILNKSDIAHKAPIHNTFQSQSGLSGVHIVRVQQLVERD